VKNELSILVSQMHSTGILYSEAVREFKKVFISHVLQQNRGNQCKAARQLGMHRNTLSRTLTELGLDVSEIRKNKDGRRPPTSAAPLTMEKKAAR
jgi:Fis family transcriptional regulator, factor for inversion stimulation protein